MNFYINVGGPALSVFNFVKKQNKFIKKRILKKNEKIGMPKNSSININKMKKIIK